MDFLLSISLMEFFNLSLAVAKWVYPLSNYIGEKPFKFIKWLIYFSVHIIRMTMAAGKPGGNK